jgi:hypothetical protein
LYSVRLGGGILEGEGAVPVEAEGSMTGGEK